MFQRLIEIGFRASSIIVVPKSYSAVPTSTTDIQGLGCIVVGFSLGGAPLGSYYQAANQQLQKACALADDVYRSHSARRYILVDDGGQLTEIWWRLHADQFDIDAVSVQQTASGMYKDRLGPAVRRIDVARSAAKKCFEASIIAAGVLRKVTDLHLLEVFDTVGVVGVGAVGSQLCRLLSKRGKTVYYHDVDQSKDIDGCRPVSRWSACVSRAGLIFGCTGHNFMANAISDLADVPRRYFVSLSSRDVEFKALLEMKEAKSSGRFGMVTIERQRSGPFLILNGGFPINFDREKEWETDAEISLTRGLVLLGILQALYLPASKPNRAIEKLAIKGQKQLVEIWLKRRGKLASEYGVTNQEFESRIWWCENSGGDEYKGNWASTLN